MIFGPLKKTKQSMGSIWPQLYFTRRLKLDPCSHTCTHPGGDSPQPAFNRQPVALGTSKGEKSFPEPLHMLTAWRRVLTHSSDWCWKPTHGASPLTLKWGSGRYSERNVSVFYSQPLQATQPVVLKPPHQFYLAASTCMSSSCL